MTLSAFRSETLKEIGGVGGLVLIPTVHMHNTTVNILTPEMPDSPHSDVEIREPIFNG